MKNKFSEKNKFYILLFLELILLTGAFVISIYLGSEKFSLKEILLSLFNKQKNNLTKVIVWNIRLPRSLLVMFTGFLLAGAGTVFQGFFRNPLAEPGIMGISSGATLGAVLSLLFPGFLVFKYFQPITIFAFFGAILSGIIIYILSYRKNRISSSSSIILTGTALGTLFSSITSIILLAKQNQLHAIYVWILGSFSGKGWKEFYFLIIPFIISLILIFICSKFLDVLVGGESSAQSLGLNIKSSRLLILITGSLASACSVCAGGTIGFVGLIAPHIIRYFIGPKHKYLVPLSVLFGGILLLVSDTLARILIAPSELPVGIITSLLGAPFFISLIYSKDKGVK